MPSISKRRLKSLLAAEALAQQLRDSISQYGGMTRDTLAYLDQWIRHTNSNNCYKKPKMPSPIWCSQCRKKHVYGKKCPS